MTAYVIFDAIKDGKITLDKQDRLLGARQSARPRARSGLPVGAEMTVETALQALIVKSANDVAVMLAEAVPDRRRPSWRA